MDSSYILPFVQAVENVFDTMLHLTVQAGAPSVKSSGQPSYDVSGIVSMAGDVEGAVVLSFPTTTAERVVSLFTGAELDQTHADFADAVGELVNMISGNAKAKFEGKQVDISCPSVIVGAGHVVFNAKDMTGVLIPFTCEVGDFAVEVAFRNSGAASVSTRTDAAADAAIGEALECRS